MLGPLAVDGACRKLGVGAALMDHALALAKRRGHGAVILLGDAPYYARFGFSAQTTSELFLPGPFERDRLLGLELREGALDGAWGMIAPSGDMVAAVKSKIGRRVPGCCAPPYARHDSIMPTQQPPARDVANPRARTIANILLIMLAVMIIMDIFARRRAAPARSLPA